MKLSSSARNRLFLVVAVIVLAILFLVPTAARDYFKNRSWISKPISLGLDLSGGVQLVYEVQTKEAVKSRLGSISLGIKTELRKQNIAVVRTKVTDDNTIELTFFTDSLAERARELIDRGYRDLKFIQKNEDGTKRILLYGISDTYASKTESDSVSQAIETLRSRVDQFGVSEPVIQKVGQNRILLQMPGVTDITAVKRIVGSVAKLEFRLLPRGENAANTTSIKDKAGGNVNVEDEVLMGGDAVDDARVSLENGQVEVSLSLTPEGARTFKRITTENTGRQLAIILDNQMYSAPRINEPIGGGRASISGGFKMEEAKELAVVLRSGALPAPLKVLEEKVVGPSLGKESIKSGIMAILGGLAFIGFFMVIYYRKSGLLAAGTLVLNLLFVTAILSAFGATLTLPGLAGLALSIGVSVDANVLIFERIRDEIRNKTTRDAAVQAGFDKAWTAILDSNVSNLFSAFVLYFLGTGPIRGFAVTLIIGIIGTFFCAVFVGRLAYDIFDMTEGKELSV